MKIVTMAAPHVPEVARVHQHAFPQFFLNLAWLGFFEGFLPPLLPRVRCHFVRGAVRRGRGHGLCGGIDEQQRFFPRMLTREFFPLALGAVMAAARNPRHVLRLTRGIFYRGEAFVEEGDALLSSLAVAPGAQGKGVGGALLRAWIGEARQRGSTGTYLITDAHGNDEANRFYAHAGWTVSRQKATREGRVMNVYTFPVANV